MVVLPGNKLVIYAIIEHETRSTVKSRSKRTTTEDHRQLLKEGWEYLKLPLTE